MKKITNKWKLALYGCSGLGVNMLNLVVASYLCSALLVGGFEDQVECWTYLNKDLVVAGLWGVLIFAAKLIDGLIDIPISHFVDNLKSKWGKRKTAILMGFIPMIIAYVLFLVPLDNKASILNTVWFAALLLIFYGFYTLTMLTYYATFAEVAEKQEDIVFVSNVKSVCDVIYFVFGYALIPVFIALDMNIRIVALIFLPLAFTMLIPLFMLKENEDADNDVAGQIAERTTLRESVAFVFKDKPFILWLAIVFVMNAGLQLFLSGINEYFSTTGLNMTVVMASCFVPVPFTIALYNKIVNKKGLGFAFRYILLVYSIGMSLMAFCGMVPKAWLYPFAIMCSVIVSFAIGAFFSVSYTVPSNRASLRMNEKKAASSMYFAISGLWEAASAGLASGVILVFLKQSGYISFMTVIVAAFCMMAFVLSYFLPETITKMGKTSGDKEA